jgi:hypothetical protein
MAHICVRLLSAVIDRGRQLAASFPLWSRSPRMRAGLPALVDWRRGTGHSTMEAGLGGRDGGVRPHSDALYVEHGAE